MTNRRGQKVRRDRNKERKRDWGTDGEGEPQTVIEIRSPVL